MLRYGFGRSNDGVIEKMEEALSILSQRVGCMLGFFNPDASELDKFEFRKICEDKFFEFEEITKSMSPFHRMVIGVRYVLQAISDCREQERPG